MPFMVNDTVALDGVSFARGQVVADDVGRALALEHPGALTRIPHDDDLCDPSCTDPSHAGVAPSNPLRTGLTPSVTAPTAPTAPASPAASKE